MRMDIPSTVADWKLCKSDDSPMAAVDLTMALRVAERELIEELRILCSTGYLEDPAELKDLVFKIYQRNLFHVMKVYRETGAQDQSTRSIALEYLFNVVHNECGMFPERVEA
jgi:hypothetical protein